jgi:hypothetical protein
VVAGERREVLHAAPKHRGAAAELVLLLDCVEQEAPGDRVQQLVASLGQRVTGRVHARERLLERSVRARYAHPFLDDADLRRETLAVGSPLLARLEPPLRPFDIEIEQLRSRRQKRTLLRDRALEASSLLFSFAVGVQVFQTRLQRGSRRGDIARIELCAAEKLRRVALEIGDPTGATRPLALRGGVLLIRAAPARAAVLQIVQQGLRAERVLGLPLDPAAQKVADRLQSPPPVFIVALDRRRRFAAALIGPSPVPDPSRQLRQTQVRDARVDGESLGKLAARRIGPFLLIRQLRDLPLDSLALDAAVVCSLCREGRRFQNVESASHGVAAPACRGFQRKVLEPGLGRCPLCSRHRAGEERESERTDGGSGHEPERGVHEDRSSCCGDRRAGKDRAHPWTHDPRRRGRARQPVPERIAAAPQVVESRSGFVVLGCGVRQARLECAASLP